jgi:Nif-specific regulatory protein
MEEIAHSGILSAARVTSLICVPLLMHTSRDRVTGAIYLDTTDAAHQFDKEHLRVLSAIAGYAAVAVYNARRIQQLENENQRLRSKEQVSTTMVGDSGVLREFCHRLHRVAGTDATVLITGESGTGKELTARALHLNSPRAAKPFEAINCAQLQSTLLESELFGYEKGAFTDARAQKRGRLELADGGTVFLDELAELPESPQAMLLRFLQEREFLRVGGTRPIHVDVRLIAATNKNLEQAVKDKSFREDLFYRLNVICLRVPPLRDRREDIPLLAQHFLRRAAARYKRLVSDVSPAALRLMMAYSWPGNVRELENAVEHAVVFASTDEVLPEDLPEHLHAAVGRENPTVVSNYHDQVRKAREQIVLNALHQAGYQFGEAAKLLGIHANNVHRLIRELNLKERIARREQ